MSVNVVLDPPCAITAGLNLPGYPPTLVAVLGADGKPDILDQPDDEPRAGEVLHLYGYVSYAFIDYRDRRQGVSGKYAFYKPVPEGVYVCLDCGARVISPPPAWPFERCTHWRSGFHRLDKLIYARLPVPSA